VTVDERKVEMRKALYFRFEKDMHALCIKLLFSEMAPESTAYLQKGKEGRSLPCDVIPMTKYPHGRSIKNVNYDDIYEVCTPCTSNSLLKPQITRDFKQ
jgi:hypothetical protein